MRPGAQFEVKFEYIVRRPRTHRGPAACTKNISGLWHEH